MKTSAKTLAYIKQWNQEHPEKRKEYKKRYRDNNKEKLKAYYEANRERFLEAKNAHYQEQVADDSWRNEKNRKSREWSKKNLEKRSKISRNYKDKYPERVRANSDRWIKNNPERRREIARAADRKHRAHKLNLNENFTAEMERFVRKFWGNRCAICHRKQTLFNKKLSMDHWLSLVPADGSQGHALDMDNAVLMCPNCNSKKSNKAPIEVFDIHTVTMIEDRLEQQQEEWSNL